MRMEIKIAFRVLTRSAREKKDKNEGDAKDTMSIRE
jgi:hypothetical protein